jgi:hypothetical protein
LQREAMEIALEVSKRGRKRKERKGREITE